jgi:hypothetical protein
MKIESPLHAEHQLDQLAGQFAHWRQTRTHPGERFPQALWDHAVALAATLPPSRVAKQLRLRLIDLKKPDSTGLRGGAPIPFVIPLQLVSHTPILGHRLQRLLDLRVTHAKHRSPDPRKPDHHRRFSQ